MSYLCKCKQKETLTILGTIIIIYIIISWISFKKFMFFYSCTFSSIMNILSLPLCYIYCVYKVQCKLMTYSKCMFSSRARKRFLKLRTKTQLTLNLLKINLLYTKYLTKMYFIIFYIFSLLAITIVSCPSNVIFN